VRQNFGSRSGISHFQLPEHAPTVDPSQTAITMVEIFRIPRASCRKLRRGCDSFVPAWRFAALQTGGLCSWGSRWTCGLAWRIAPEMCGALGCQRDAGGLHRTAVLNAHQTVAHGIFPDRHARTIAPPRLHGLAIGTPFGDEIEELQRQSCRRRLFGRRCARLAGTGTVRTRYPGIGRPDVCRPPNPIGAAAGACS
jgi:hypothetical protein